jgi:5-methyltetrahydrofolate--homocysteine methyltransferase
VTGSPLFLNRARAGRLRLDGATASYLHALSGAHGAPRSCDHLSLSAPAQVTALHQAYLGAGADIVRTNTFRAASREHADDARAICLAAARLARDAADDWSRRSPDRPRFVAGAIGPPDPQASHDDARAACRAAMRALLDGGVDLLLLETCFAPAQVSAAMAACADAIGDAARAVPLLVSLALDAGGRLAVSGAPIDDAIGTIDPAIVAGLGINCGLGPEGLETALARLRRHAPIVTCHPSAGLPDARGQYRCDPGDFARRVAGYAASGLADIVGGCCGTTPAHVAALAAAETK